MRGAYQRYGLFGQFIAVAWFACVALPASAQFYTFTSGPSGDGITWPLSPTGLIDGDYFATPDGTEFGNFTSNSIFFDDQYLVAGNSPRISGDAMWGNTAFDSSAAIEVSFFGSAVQSIDFDFAQAAAGAPGVTPDYIDIEIGDSEGRYTIESFFLDESFSGFGGIDGMAGHIALNTFDLFDFTGEFEGDDQFVDIEYLYIDMNELSSSSSTVEFAFDNFSIDGSTGGGEIYPSVNGGADNASGSTLGSSVLRGTGTHSAGVEVTNGSGVTTNFSTAIVPGGDLTDGGQVSGVEIGAGQSLFNPGLATVDRSLPTGKYESDITVSNDNDLTDPDDTVTISIKIFDAPALTGNFADVDVLAAQTVDLDNADAVVDGYRASVKVTGTTTTGGFAVQGYDLDTPVKPGEAVQGNATFDRYGQLSGSHSGTFTASLKMTAYVGISSDFETFLAEAEPVADQVWNLSYELSDTNTDSVVVNVSDPLAKSVGVNDSAIAATLVDGESAENQTVSMSLTSDPGANAALAGTPVDLTFGSGNVDPFALQFTYLDGNIPSGFLESDLQVLFYNTVAGEWEVAVDSNSSGAATFYSGSYEDYLAGSGGVFDAGDLGVFGVDVANNHAWAILDHASTFALGVLTAGGLGDFDDDGDVDGADFLAWQRNPSVGTLSDWESQFGDGGEIALATVVPEPTTLAFVGVFLALIGANQRAASRWSC